MESMLIENILSEYPKDHTLKDASKCVIRPLESTDEMAFHEFFLAVPMKERMFIKHRVTEPAVIHDWCQNIDYGRNLPLLAVGEGRILADATLHQQLGGWRRHIGRVSVLVHPQLRARGLATALVTDPYAFVARTEYGPLLELVTLDSTREALVIAGRFVLLRRHW